MNEALRRSAAHVFVESLEHPVLAAEDVHHLLRVLRLRAGESVSVSDGNGSWRLCAVGSGEELEPRSEVEFDHSTRSKLTVAVALPKGDRPEWIVQKLTEIGIDEIQFLHTERSVVRWDSERSTRNVRKLRTVAREASMQSRRLSLPVVNEPCDLLTFLRTHNATTSVAAADPTGERLGPDIQTVLIGPEGGWTQEELTSAGRSVTLGDNVLRVETAALVAATQMVAHGHGRW